MVFYELLTGEVPMGQFEPPSKKTPIDARLDDVVLRALASEPERRFQSAGELKSSVNAISSVEVESVAGPSPEAPAAPRPGVSTIMEREAVAAWRWVAGEADSTKTNTRPEFPALLMLLLSIAGCLSVMLPWIDVEIVKSKASPAMRSAMDLAQAGTDDYVRCFLQTAEFSPPVGNSAPINEHHHTFNGLDKWPGLVVCSTFALLTLLLIALPPRHRRMIRWSLLMTLLAGLALLHTFLFKLEVDMSLVSLPSGQTRLSEMHRRGSSWHISNIAPEAAAVQKPRHFLAFQEAYDNNNLTRLSEIDHRPTYRVGFYCALGLSVTMLVLSATGIRHAIAHGVGDSLQSKHPGLPLGHVHFSARQSPDIRERIKSHFFELGYQLVQENDRKWIFHRERKPAGPTSTDIQAFDTTLTIRANAGAMGVVWVNCRWNVHMVGAMIFRGDIADLEAEGHKLESLLNADALDTPLTPGNETHVPSDAFDSIAGSGSSVHVQPSPPSVDGPGREFGRSFGESAELEELQALVDRPAIALMATGGLTSIGCLLTVIEFLSDSSYDDDAAMPFFLASAAVGAIVAFGAWNMRGFRSPGLSMMGAILGLLPVTPGAMLSIPLSIWAIRVLNRPDVRTAFIVRRRQRKHDADVSESPRFSRKAIVGACLIPVFLFFAPLMLMSVWIQRAGVSEEPAFAILMIGLPGLLAPSITTILGFMAVSEIRRSNGRLVGLGLAFADAALFPFLLLDCLIFGACWFALQDAGVPTDKQAMVLLIVVTFLVLTNALSGWWLWQKVKTE
ncbi:MAG: hypothetical protein GY903_12040 [Fuerstiella sp.]|nr:hypothetical protein [Fuerstiella sp.]